MDDKTDPRTAILSAAMARILHYGYGKTTMAEIASDCCMSAGNIYRFFNGKVEIAEALARRHHDELLQEYARIAADKKRSASERLYDARHMLMERSFHMLEKGDKLLEVAEVLSQERPLYMNEEMAQERIHLVKILEDGVESGEFAPLDDPNFTAEMIQSATMKFSYPQMFSRLNLERLERELRGVMEIILLGLRAKS